MKGLVLISVVLVLCSWSYGSPGPESSRAFAYVDTSGNRFPSFQGYGMSGSNSAFAAGAVGPGFRRQVASINPENPRMPNVDTSYYSQPNPNGNDFYSVSSSSYSSSVNDNGQVQSQRGAETVVNDRGQITRYSVRS